MQRKPGKYIFKVCPWWIMGFVNLVFPFVHFTWCTVFFSMCFQDVFPWAIQHFSFFLLYVFAVRKPTKPTKILLSTRTKKGPKKYYNCKDPKSATASPSESTKSTAQQGQKESNQNKLHARQVGGRRGMPCWYLNPNTLPVLPWSAALTVGTPKGGANKTMYSVLSDLTLRTVTQQYMITTMCAIKLPSFCLKPDYLTA